MNRFQNINKLDMTPIYYQVFLSIKNEIDLENIKNGDFLPSEKELSNYFGVSRVTIRTALKKLKEIGYVKKEQGKNSYVFKSMSDNIWVDFRDFTTDLRREDFTLVSEVLFSDYVDPNEMVKNMLDLDDGEKVFCLERVRTINDVKVVYSKSFLANRIGVDFKNIKFEPTTSLKKVLIDRKISMEKCDETLEAQIPSPYIKGKLGLDDSTAVFYRERVTYDQNNMPFEYVFNYYSGKHYKYFVEKGKTK